MEVIETIINGMSILSGILIAAYICKKQNDEYKQKRDKILNNNGNKQEE